MKIERIIRTIQKLRFVSIIDGCDRAEFIRKYDIFAGMGKNCMFQSRKFPMDPKMVKIHDNVTVAADVTFCTHDAIRHVLQFYDDHEYVPHMGCIEIEDNVFVGLGTIIMPNVHIGKNSIIAAGSLVLKDVPAGSVVGGHPAKFIGDFEDIHQKRIKEAELYSNKKNSDYEALLWQNFDRAHGKNI